MSAIILNEKEGKIYKEFIETFNIDVEGALEIDKILESYTSNKKFSPQIGQNYYYIESGGNIVGVTDYGYTADIERFDTGNYCHDKSLLQQRAYQETLSRLLWRYRLEHDKKVENFDEVYCIAYSQVNGFYIKKVCFDTIDVKNMVGFTLPYFKTVEIARQAIEDIVRPFVESHPDFKISSEIK